MACFHPIHGWYGKEKTEKGKRPFVFNRNDSYDTGHQVTIPCGRCDGCKIERTRQWAMRCLHESTLYLQNCFITLTYDNEHLEDDSLHLTHFQNFLKKLRKRYTGHKIRFFHCGEYGDRDKRPHYHACLFNFDFPDKKLWKEKNGTKLYTSDECNEIWQKGYCVIGEVTFDSAQYVAKYILKKQIGQNQGVIDEYYHGRKEEYITMSRRPGIGYDWFKKYSRDVYSGDYNIINERKVKPPKYYDSLYDNIDEIKISRRNKLPEETSKHELLAGYPSVITDNGNDRLLVKQKVLQAKIKLKERNL